MRISGYRNHNERVRDEQARTVVKAAQTSANNIALLQSIDQRLHISNLLAITASDMFTEEQRQEAAAAVQDAMFEHSDRRK